jgi:hypothetical protein
VKTARLLFPLTALTALALSGCGGKGEVSGKVRFNGAPLSTGRIMFISQDEPSVSAFSTISEDGGYKVADCPLGPVRITVQTLGYRGAHPGRAVIPARYVDPAKSGLDYTVKPGRQPHDVDLAP